MNVLEAIAKRKSRRSYLETPIEDKKLESLQALIKQCNGEGHLSIQVVKDGRDAFQGFKKRYGLFSGVKTLIAMAGKKDDIYLKEKVGYYGALLVLEATRLDLGTCWVGAIFDSGSPIFHIKEDEVLVSVITVGNVAQETLEEKLVHKIATRKTKAANEFYSADRPAPEWFMKGIEAVQKAPSAQNRQPVQFIYKDGGVQIFAEDSYKFDLIDLGIAKAHFSLAAGGYFEWGNYSRFIEERV